MTLKLKFDSNLQFQLDAVSSVVDLFEGQPAEEVISLFERKQSELVELAVVGNRLVLDQSTLLENLKRVQDRCDIAISKHLDGLNFSVEMETGTGKTYVYLRTIFELNKRYGFKKFVVVVPSIAIREGVLKSLKIMKEHFQDLYNRAPLDYYEYDPKSINNISRFARSNTIQILIINIDAFRKTLENVDDESKANIIHRSRDQLHGRKPIEFIQAAKPIVIIDEPQSVDGTEKAQQAIQTLNPLCTLRYSATHKNLYNHVYSLNAIKAYDQRLVKKVQVASIMDEATGENAFARLVSVDNKNGIKAKLVLHVLKKGTPTEKNVTVKRGSDLYELSDNNDIYRNGYVVTNIDTTPSNEYVEFDNGTRITFTAQLGGNEDDIKRTQIRETIRHHLDNELRLRTKGIKVLSLFFIDRVANYREYTEDNQATKGKFAVWFEEAFAELINKPHYSQLKKEAYGDFASWGVEKIHDGYFSQDKKGQWKDTRGNTADDDSTYDKIMKNKEQLLGMDEPLRFIFSHSALREGWDNPNVFQICTLNETSSGMKKRQEIGRGLRLPVNQLGERIKDDAINRLTVVANESYKQFCRTLQSEFEHDGIEFGKVSPVAFKNFEIIVLDGPNQKVGSMGSEAIHAHLVEKGYLTTEGNITEKFQPAQKDFLLDIDEKFVQFRPKIVDTLKAHLLTSRIENLRDKKERKFNKEIRLDPEFAELWRRISPKTTYSVEYDTNDLVAHTVKRFRQQAPIKAPKISIETREVTITQAGVDGEQLLQAGERDTTPLQYVPDVLTMLDKELEHKVTRKAIARMLLESGRIEELKINPQEYIKQLVPIVKAELNKLIVYGIKYERIEGAQYEMYQFDQDEIKEYFINRAIECKKHIYDVVEYDSDIEREFAQVLDRREDIKLFVKLPRWFVIQTPLGTYNPDWAIVKHGDDKVYLVRETKGTLDYSQLRNSEEQKINCGKKHFESLGTGVNFGVAVHGNQI